MLKKRNFALVTLTLVILVLYLPVLASDTDSPPFLIYVDPVTGKYTKNNPEHESTPQQSQQTSNVTNTPRQVPPATQILPAFLIAGGLLLGGHLLSWTLVNIKKS